METLKTEILNDLMVEIDKKDFDLEAWKMKASMVMRKFFGQSDEKVSLIQNLRYDFSSWALRDSSGGKQHDTVKDNAKRIIETALLEISISENENVTASVLQDELTGSEYSALKALTEKTGDVTNEIAEFIHNLTPEKKELLLTKLVMKSFGK